MTKFWPLSCSAVAWSKSWLVNFFRPTKIEYKTASWLSTISTCLYPFSNDICLFAIGMDSAHRYINMRRIVYVYLLRYKPISYFVKKSGRNFIQQIVYRKFCQFSFQIRATRIPVCPSCIHCNWRCRSSRHRRQTATLPWGENWLFHSENHQWKHFFPFGVLVLSRLVALSGLDYRQQFLLKLGHRILRKPNTPSPIHCVADGEAMSNLAVY